MNILYEDNYFIIVEKPSGLLSEKSESGNDVVTEINKQLNINVFPAHRLDSGTGGAMVLAKTGECAARFSQMIQNGKFNKEYLTIVKGCPEPQKGIYEDLLFKDSSKNKSFVVDRERKGVKKASLEYNVLESKNNDGSDLSLVHVVLHTGRTHQIRVQFSHRKMPVLGDVKYGSKDERCGVSLWSHKISFIHPYNGQNIFAVSFPENKYPWNLFTIEGK